MDSVSRVPQGRVLGLPSLTHSVFQRNICSGGNRMPAFAYCKVVTLADKGRHDGATSLNRDLVLFMNDAIIDARLTHPLWKPKPQFWSGPWPSTLPMATLSCRLIVFRLIQNLTYYVKSLRANSLLTANSNPSHNVPLLPDNWYIEVGEARLCWHYCVASLSMCTFILSHSLNTARWLRVNWSDLKYCCSMIEGQLECS